MHYWSQRSLEKLIRFIFAALLMVIACEAFATPGRTVFFDSDINAITGDSAYLRIDVSDNAGTYTVTRRDSYLLAIDRETSFAKAVFPLRSTIQDTVNSVPGALEELEVGNRVEANAVLIEAEAVPISPHIFSDERMALIDGALLGVRDVDASSGFELLISKEELRAIARSQISAIMERYPELSEVQYLDMSGRFLSPQSVHANDECQIASRSQPLWVDDHSGENSDGRIAIRMNCNDGEEGGLVCSFFVFLDWVF